MPSTFYQTLFCPTNAICKNKEGTQCAVGGRNLLKVFSIEDHQFSESLNLVAGHKRLIYSITDVQWHPIEENIIASAAGNGVVILWDLNKEQKQDHIFQQHYRFVSKICFHPADASLLMSCSQDGNMNCFDIRRKEVSLSFCGKTDSIRDVQFHPFERQLFCAAGESGNVQLWDMRRTDQHLSLLTAHTGPVFTLHWHPEERNWLATGGRDKCVKVWDTNNRNHPIHIVQTIAAVARIKWRPNHKYHIASCALVLDHNVNIWDIRRPYIPFAAFQEHTDVATGIEWQKDPDILLSCSKDKTIFHHTINNAERPIKKAPSMAMSLSPCGMVAHAFPDATTRPKLQKLNTTPQVSSSGQLNVKRQSIASSQDFRPEKSALNIYQISELFDEYWLAVLAKEYIFHGKSLTAICEHNCRAAEQLGLVDKAQTWSILGQLYQSNDMMHCVSSLPSPHSITSHTSQLIGNETLVRKLETPEIFLGASNLNSSLSSSEESLNISHHLHPNTLNDMTLVGPELDAVFGDEDCTGQLFPGDGGPDEDDLDCLPSEAFQLRESFDKKALQQQQVEEEEDVKRTKTKPFVLRLPVWNFTGLVKDMLMHYAEQGDLQMCVTVLLALNNLARGMIDAATQEDWFHGYLEILTRLRLFTIATEVVNHAPSPVNSINQNSTVVHMQCGTCYKVIEGTSHGWYCRNCKKITQVCSICHIPVKGLYVWCQGCGHGGHLNHLRIWYNKHTLCPTGCGHKCQYS